MDLNTILSTIGSVMAAFNVPTELGQAFLKFVEFWYVLFSGLFNFNFGSIVDSVTSSIGGITSGIGGFLGL